LETITEEVGKIEKINCKIDEFDIKLNLLHKEVTRLATVISDPPNEEFSVPVKKQGSESAPVSSQSVIQGSSSTVINCKQWSDFQVLTMHALSLSFGIKEVEKTFQVNALKNNQIIVYNGPLPTIYLILAAWLSQELEVPKQNIIEGTLSLT